MDNLLAEREVAARLALSLSTLRNWRVSKRGPAYLKIGKRAVRYRLEDLEKFIAQGKRDAGAQP